MGILSDVLQGIPTNAVLREKISAVEDRYGAIETENAILKDDNRKLKTENQKLRDEIERLTHTDNLQEEEVKILTHLANPKLPHDEDTLAGVLQIHPTRLEYYLESLSERDYIFSAGGFVGEAAEYEIDQKGRGFLIKNKLI